MSTRLTSARKSRKRSVHRKNSRGAALITSLLLLLLLTGLTVAMVVTANSDMLINGYYRGFRGSFYAADSGLTVARQQMVNQLLGAGSASFSGTTPPIPVGTENLVKSSVNSLYGSSFQTLNSGQSSASWPESFKLDPTATSLVASPPTTTSDANGKITGYQYVYNYTLRGFGRSSGNQVTTLSDSGTIKINVVGTAGGTNTSFAAYGMFINTYDACSSALVPGTITGPVFTNGSWNFGTGGSGYIFTDTVGSADSSFSYLFSGNKCVQSSATSAKSGNTTIAPTFQSGVNLGATAVPLPANDYNQKRAILDGKGTGSTNPSNAEMNAVLKSATGAAWPNNGNSSGVYIPYSVDASTGQKTFTGGGIYVKGDAAVVLSPGSNGAQIYTITQGGTVTTVTVDVVGNSTTITSGASTQTVTGVPSQIDPATNAVQRDATMLYVDGNITSLKGPGQGQAAISDQTALTITAAGNVTVTGDILYASKPVTTTQNQIPNTPADTLIPGNDHGQALGIFTATGDIQMANAQSNGNLEIDASLATISQTGSGGLINSGNAINTLTIIGGRIQNNIKNINTTTRNVFFDRRYAQNGFAPPWFPSTTVTSTALTTSQYTSNVQRLKWLNNTSYY